jgi:hypothetical protein
MNCFGNNPIYQVALRVNAGAINYIRITLVGSSSKEQKENYS